LDNQAKTQHNDTEEHKVVTSGPVLVQKRTNQYDASDPSLLDLAVDFFCGKVNSSNRLVPNREVPVSQCPLSLSKTGQQHGTDLALYLKSPAPDCLKFTIAPSRFPGFTCHD
jgi:hypothetical protein